MNWRRLLTLRTVSWISRNQKTSEENGSTERKMRSTKMTNINFSLKSNRITSEIQMSPLFLPHLVENKI
jgi:hypothetical protein